MKRINWQKDTRIIAKISTKLLKIISAKFSGAGDRPRKLS